MTPGAMLIIGVFVWLLGLCVGSFLNVVIYRMPRGLSIHKPARSFCPACSATISWYDNLPVFSWVLLHGRCRACGSAISLQYPLVEALTGLLYCLVFHLLFGADSRAGLGVLSWPADSPLLLAWLALIATMIACSATDLVSYMIDTRVTNTAVWAGLLIHAVWPHQMLPPATPAQPLGLAAVAALVVSAVMLWLTAWRPDSQEDDPEPETPDTERPHVTQAPHVALGSLAAATLAGLSAWLLVKPLLDPHSTPLLVLLPVPVVLGVIFVMTVLIGGQKREADDELEAAIDEEEAQARALALSEAGWLAPIIIAGVAAGLLAAWVPVIGNTWSHLATWSPGGGIAPIGGVAYAALGAVVGASAGWVLRIGFTLVFGREAFGVGDIYTLGAAGALGGWDIALLGLALSVALALAGWLLGLLLKRSMMIPFGPWLALGFVAALWLNKPALDVYDFYADSVRLAWQQNPQMLAVAGGIMLVGAVAAVVIAKFVRRLVEPR